MLPKKVGGGTIGKETAGEHHHFFRYDGQHGRFSIRESKNTTWDDKEQLAAGGELGKVVAEKA